MKYFHRNSRWIEDKRTHEKNSSKSYQRQIDKIKETLPCSVAEAFAIVGIFFETIPDTYIHWDSSLKDNKLFNYVQKISNKDNKSYYVLFFDDDSPVIYRNSKIALFKSEEEMKFANELITKKLNSIGSNTVIKTYLFKPD